MIFVRIIDVGCGPGIYVDALISHGHNVVGIDVDKNNPYDKCDIFSDDFLAYANFDLCICLEVAEHIHEDKADELIRRLTNTSDTILFSAAVPGQGGYGHINCQPKEYWITKFNNNNYILDEVATNKFVNHMLGGYHLGWLTNNAMVFKSYSKMYYKQIIEEETPQAVRIAEYLSAVTL
jgi:SAM-dependent methyltransferase